MQILIEPLVKYHRAQAAEASANQAKAQAWSSAIGGVGSIVSAGLGGCF